jgi:Flp pilus assembly protein TadD
MRYALSFTLIILLLTAGALTTFRQISASSGGGDTLVIPPAREDELTPEASPLNPTAADYARFERADGEWRAQHARQYSLAELRVRGDGTRSAREAMQDRVYSLTRKGDRARAIAELERWTGSHPRDRDALLWLARLLSEAGRKEASIARYRQILALAGEKS